MLKNNIAIISKNQDNITALTNIINESDAHIYIYDTITDLEDNTDRIVMDAIFCYYGDLSKISDLVGFKKVFLIDTELNDENKKLAYENAIYEYFYHPLNDMDILHRLEIINRQKLELYNSNSSCISLLTQLVNIKDGGSNGHLIRMRNVVGLFLEELLQHKDYKHYFSESLCYEITQASLLHDIGKMAIPENILEKTGSLTFEEFEIMRQHPSVGHKILSTTYNKFTANNIIKLAIDIVESHHERWNGEGYPNRLKGENIPLNARIIAICDVYDTVLSSNSYKNSSTHEYALETILLEGGKRFDPNLVAVFMGISDIIKSERHSRFAKMKIYHQSSFHNESSKTK